jgi:hypothetical protein
MTEEEFTPEPPAAPEPPYRSPSDAPAGYATGWEDGWKAGYAARKEEEAQEAKESYWARYEARRKGLVQPAGDVHHVAFEEVCETVPCAYCGADVGVWCRTLQDGISIAPTLHTTRAADYREHVQQPVTPETFAAVEGADIEGMGRR